MDFILELVVGLLMEACMAICFLIGLGLCVLGAYWIVGGIWWMLT